MEQNFLVLSKLIINTPSCVLFNVSAHYIEEHIVTGAPIYECLVLRQQLAKLHEVSLSITNKNTKVNLSYVTFFLYVP